MHWEPRVLATRPPGKSLSILLEKVFFVLFLRVDRQAGFFLSPYACHHGIIAQALELNGLGLNTKSVFSITLGRILTFMNLICKVGEI